jgi:hypothetical protein
MNRYKASMDKVAWVITISSCALLGFVSYISVSRILDSAEFSGYAVHVVSLVICITTGIGTWLYAPSSYEVTRQELIVRRPATNKRFLLSEIVSARLLDKSEMKGTIRTFGVGGLFGYYGKFASSSLGPFTMYGTQMRKLLLIHLRSGKKVIISPDDTGILNYLVPGDKKEMEV